MCKKKQQDTLGQIIKQTQRLQKIKYNPSFFFWGGGNTGLEKKLDMTCKQNTLYQITQGNKKTKHQKVEETREDQWRDFWMCESRMGATPWQLHDDDDDDDDDDNDDAFFSENCAIYEIMLKNIV